MILFCDVILADNELKAVEKHHISAEIVFYPPVLNSMLIFDKEAFNPVALL